MEVLALLLLGVIPRDPVTDETVDLLERNYCHDCDGTPQFVQWIGWAEADGWRMEVIDWRIVPRERAMVYLPGHRPVLIFTDGDHLRVIRGRFGRTTWTQHDPELDERHGWPVHCRRLFAK